MNNDLLLLANKALEFVPDAARIGLGSGQTMETFLRVLGERVCQGLRVWGIPTSAKTAQLALEFGIPLDTLDRDPVLEATIDGADEVERGTLNLIKGCGGAMLRERVVAAASLRQIILATEEKVVERLGTRGKLPVEVAPFAAPFCRRQIDRMIVPGGLQAELRLQAGRPFVTDNGNWILDCSLQPLDDPAALDRALRAIPGVADTGLFLGTAAIVLVAEDGVVRELRSATLHAPRPALPDRSPSGRG